MAVDRIDKVLNLNNTGRFIVVFGAILEESFVGDDLELYPKEEILHLYAKKNGFRRIIFFDGLNNLHTYDVESVQLTNPNFVRENLDQSKSDTVGIKSEPSAGNRGRPLGGRRRILQPKKQRSNSVHKINSYVKNRKGYYSVPCGKGKFLVDDLDSYIRDENVKTAIFIKFSDLPGHFQTPAPLAHFFTTLEGWGSLSPINNNKCFLISSSSKASELQEEIRTFPKIKSIINLNSEKGGPQTLLHIAQPHQDELKRLIQRKRITKDLLIDWNQLKSVIRIMDQELKNISYWFQKLTSLKMLNKNSMRNIVSDNADFDDRDPLEKLDTLIGLSGVKEEVKKQLAILKAAEHKPVLLKDIRLHLTFEGNPGTGKTTVARLISQIYREAGVLRRGHLIEADKESLVAGYLGQTAIKTKELIDSAMGGVLFIDEAYDLAQEGENNSAFGMEAVNTLLKQMEDHKDDLCVIFAGYPKQMESFLSTNPGLKRRIGQRIKFDDYNPTELYEIYLLKKRLKEIKADRNFDNAIQKILNSIYKDRDESFGNAGDVENILSEAIKNCALRLTTGDDEISLIINDIPEKYRILIDKNENSPNSAMSELKELIGLDGVKSQVRSFLNRQRAYKINPNLSKGSKFHMIFQGNPGTGKTTVARLVSKIFKEKGFLQKGHLIEVKRQDLVAGYVGQTAMKTQKVIDKAIGGVLFIDEAYTLSRSQSENDYGREAIDTLLTAMSDHADNLCIICAGYPNPMKQFLNSNEGLTRRIGVIIDFEDFNPNELYNIFLLNKKKQKFKTTKEFDYTTRSIFKIIYNERNKNFGNAGVIEKYIKDVQDAWIMRCNDAIDTMPVDKCDIPKKYLKLIGQESSSTYKGQIKINEPEVLEGFVENKEEINNKDKIGNRISELNTSSEKESNLQNYKLPKPAELKNEDEINYEEIDLFMDSLFNVELDEALELLKNELTSIENEPPSESKDFSVYFLEAFWNFFLSKHFFIEKADIQSGIHHIKLAIESFEEMELQNFVEISKGLKLQYSAIVEIENSNFNSALEKIELAKIYYQKIDKYGKYFSDTIEAIEAESYFLKGVSFFNELDYENGQIAIEKASKGSKQIAENYYTKNSESYNLFTGLSHFYKLYSAFFVQQIKLNSLDYDYFHNTDNETIDFSKNSIEYLSKATNTSVYTRINLKIAKGLTLLSLIIYEIGNFFYLIMHKEKYDSRIDIKYLTRMLNNARNLFIELDEVGIVLLRVCKTFEPRLTTISKILQERNINTSMNESENENKENYSKIKENTQSLIGKGEIGRAIKDLMIELIDSDPYNELIMLQSRYNQLIRDDIKGVISNNDKKIEMNKIANAILDVLELIEI